MKSDETHPAGSQPAPPKLTREERVTGGYYIYGLIDPQALRETDDDLLSVFYVGKGKSERWKHHQKEVLADLAREELLLERRSSKAQRIHQILDRGEGVPAIRLSAGYLDEEDAYCAESLAIDTIGAVLAAAGRPPLTNATPGHHAGFVRLHDHFVFTQTEAEVIPAHRAQPDSRPSDPELVAQAEILVKGTSTELVHFAQQVVPGGVGPAALSAVSAKVNVLDLFDASHPQTVVRRGWDPQNPWTDQEAQDRASRYWPFAAERVAGWLGKPETMPGVLLLAIPEAGGQTVVRYAWEIDRHASWGYYREMRRWGVPLGRRLHEHPRLGKALYEERDGRRVQVLLGYASGVRVLQAEGSTS